MSLRDLGRKTRSSLLDFLWRQWGQLGIAGSAAFADNWVIDPEALLLFTMEAGRYDPRLFDEVVDWTVRNERWLSLQRLKNMTEHAEENTARRGMVAFARLLSSVEKRHRWRALSQMDVPSTAQPVPFFMDLDGNPLPTFGEQDGFFAEAGLIRPPVTIRNLSRRVPMNAKAGLLIRLRSLLGLGPRAEVVAYLATHGSAQASEIARATGYSRPPVQETLNDLAEGGFILVTQHHGRKSYCLDTELWKPLLDAGRSSPEWIDWSRVFPAVMDLLTFFVVAGDERLSDYMLRSRLITQNERLNDGFANTGIANPFARPLDLADAPEEFARRVDALLESMNSESIED